MTTEEKLQKEALNKLDNKYHFIGKEDSGLILPSKFFEGISKEMVEFAKSPESLEYWKEKEKLYTEEEIVLLLQNLITAYIKGEVFSEKDWFEQNKER